MNRKALYILMCVSHNTFRIIVVICDPTNNTTLNWVCYWNPVYRCSPEELCASIKPYLHDSIVKYDAVDNDLLIYYCDDTTTNNLNQLFIEVLTNTLQ